MCPGSSVGKPVQQKHLLIVYMSFVFMKASALLWCLFCVIVEGMEVVKGKVTSF